MKRNFTLFICAGESSGDTLGTLLLTDLARCLREQAIDLRVVGMGGPQMRAVSDGNLECMEDIQAAGLAELAPKLPKIIARFRKLQNLAKREKPDLAILIDFPDFNLRLAARLKVLGIRVCIYVPPQVWAWRPQRVETLKRVADKVVTLFDFEKKYLAERGLEAVCCGHPLVTQTPTAPQPRQPRLLLCPGSRNHEIDAIFPVQLECARQLLAKRWLDKRPELQFGVLVAPGKEKRIAKHMRQSGLLLENGRISDGWTLALCAAGTVSLELALAGVPWILTHRVSPISHWMMRGRLTTPFLGMPNILMGRMVAPEFVQDALEADSLAKHASGLLGNEKRLDKIRRAWMDLRTRLQAAQTLDVAALVLDMLNEREGNG
jgi:lipid-A-disaccharide synthase